MKHPLTNEEFKKIFSRVPRLCVDIIIKTESGIVLTLRDLPAWNGAWHFPGGGVHYKEKLVDAVNRVALRETGARVKILKQLGYMEFPSEEKERGFGYSVSVVFLCELVEGELRNNEESSKVEVFSELPENMIQEHKEFILKNWEEIFGREVKSNSDVGIYRN